MKANEVINRWNMLLRLMGKMSLSNELLRAADGFKELSRIMRLTQPPRQWRKPNKMSQKKRRIIDRRLGKFKK